MFSVHTFGVFYLVKRGVLIFVGEIIMLEKWPLLIPLSTSLKGRPEHKKKRGGERGRKGFELHARRRTRDLPLAASVLSFSGII